MRQRYTLTKAEKLKSRKRIQWVFKEGKSLSLFPFKVFYLVVRPAAAPALAATSSFAPPIAPEGAVVPLRPPASTLRAPTTPLRPPIPLRPSVPPPPPAPLQAGFGAGSRHFKKAVDRNRIKRLTREAYRVQKQPLIDHLAQKGLSMSLFFVYTGKELPDHSAVKERVGVALQKLIKEVK
jgi:ribonuclease P protein component